MLVVALCYRYNRVAARVPTVLYCRNPGGRGAGGEQGTQGVGTIVEGCADGSPVASRSKQQQQQQEESDAYAN